MSIFADLFVDMMPDRITVEPILTRTYEGKATYGPPVVYIARVNYETRNVIAANGQQVVARGRAWLDTVAAFSVNDRVTFSDGTKPILLNVNQESDEDGPAYTAFDFQ